MTDRTTNSIDFEKAITDELPADYSDNSTAIQILAWMEEPEVELKRLNEYRRSQLTVDELRKILLLALEMKY